MKMAPGIFINSDSYLLGTSQQWLPMNVIAIKTLIKIVIYIIDIYNIYKI